MAKTFLSFSKATLAVFERLAMRTFVLALLTLTGCFIIDQMIDSGMHDRFALIRRFPDFIPLMMAAAKFTFIEMSLLWIRASTQPKVDVQESISRANGTSEGAAFVHFTNSLVWAFRVSVFIYLIG